MRAPWLVVIGCLLGVLALGVSACGDDDDDGDGGPGEASFELVIGDLLPLTGDLADFGPPGRKAAELAHDQIRSAAREAGVDHQVRLVHEDTQTDAQAGVSAARKLVDADDASCLAGAWASSVTIPVSRSVATRERVLQISPASTSDEITGLNDDGLTNRTPPPDKAQGPALAAVMEQELDGARGKTVNIGARNDAYGTGLADTFSAAWEERGGRIGERVVYDPEQPSYNSEAGTIVSGDPDGFVIIDFPETYNNVGPALVRTGDWRADRTFITDGLFSSDLPDSAGAEATEGMRGTFPGAPDAGRAAQAFDRLYKRAGGPQNRQAFDAQNFDAVILCYLAAVAAGEADGEAMAAEVREVSGPPGRKYTWQQLPAAIGALQDGEEIDYEGASGPIDMDDAGDATAGVYDLFRFEEGAPDVYDEVPIPRE